MASRDPVKLITTDHREVEQMFETLLSGDRPDPALVEQLVEELTVHTKVEEQVVYPTARDAMDDGPELVREGIKEHDEADKLIAQIKRKMGQGTAVRELLTKLQEEVQHHVDEEEDEFLPKLQAALDRAALATMAGQWERAKAQLKGTMEEIEASSTEDLLDLTREELYEKAKEAGIEGRSKMTKDELVEALQSL